MAICKNCNGKWYNTVFVWYWWYTDFWPREYIETTPLWIQKVECTICKLRKRWYITSDTNERIDQVLDDMEDIKFHCDMRYCDWEECKQQVKQSILRRMK